MKTRGVGGARANRWTRRLAACCVMAGFSVLGAGQAEALTVLTVPNNPQDANVPHNAYNGKQTTYKAIVRDGNCGTYEYWWDGNGDGVEESGRLTTTNPYNLHYQWQIPNQASDRLFAARVRVACNGEEAIGTYLVFVNASVPSPANANTANPDQLAIMSDVALDDVLWHLHRLGGNYGGANSAITGYISHQSGGAWNVAVTAAATWAFSLNGAYPAYPPGSYAGPEPAGFLNNNNQLWARTPYSETAMRYTNWLLTQYSVVNGINASDEADDGRPAIANRSRTTPARRRRYRWIWRSPKATSRPSPSMAARTWPRLVPTSNSTARPAIPTRAVAT